MEKELTIREWLKARDRMCASAEKCRECPAEYWCTGYKDTPEGLLDAVEQWATEHPEPKRTMLVPDEVVRVYTLEWTVVDGCELTQEQLKEAGRNVAANLKRMQVTYADDVKCVKAQQFITKAHEEEL